MTSKSKAQTFIGFAVRTGKFRIGVNAIKTVKKAYLLIICNSASENTLKEGKKLAKKLNCKLLLLKEGLLEDLTNKPNAKLMAIENLDIAKALITQAEKDFIDLEI